MPEPFRRVLSRLPFACLIAFAFFLLGSPCAHAQGGDAAQFISQTAPPAEIQAGLPYTVTVTMKNTGTTTWTTGPQPANAQPSGYMLVSASPLGQDIWNTVPGIQNPNNSVPMSATGPSASVGPNQTATFTFTAYAPSGGPGAYNFQWQMMHNFIRFFGDVTPNVVCSVLTDNAAFVSQVPPPATMTAGQSYPVSVTMQNTGASTWQDGTCQILSENPRGNQLLGPSNYPVVGTVVPGGSTTVSFMAVAPSTPGSYNFQWSLSRKNIHEFGQFSTNVPVTVVAAPPSLTAAATGANKITLYWSGVSGASGYNVYRSTVSGGPYALIASGASTADPGPGMTGAFMYSDTAGLVTGTEYFYVVTAVQSGTEGVQSNEASASPDPNAVPWDTGNAALIVSQLTTSISSALEPDIDPDTGDEYPATAGILTACGPNGVLYQGNYTDGSPATAYPPSAYYDSSSGTIIYGDGTAASAPAEGDTSADAPAAGSTPATSSNSLTPNFQISDLYNYAGNNTGIWRKVLSQPGFWGASGTCGLPNLNDPNSVVLAVHSFPPNAVDNKGKPLTIPYSDSGDIYFGGTVDYPANPKTGQPAPYSNYELDLGLQASASLASTSVPGWVPVINSVDKNRSTPVSATGTTRSTVATGVTLSNINGSIAGRKIYAINETRMQFITPNFANISDQTVALHIAPPFASVAGGKILVAPFQLNNGVLSLGPAVSYSAATLVYYARGWRKSAMNNASGNNLFSIKRTNSIAQSLFDATHQAYPMANGPTESNVKSFLIDSSAIRGAYWGNNGDSRGVELNSNGSWTPWTDDSSQSLHSGAYPNSKIGGYGYVNWVKQNGFTWETNINLKANHTLP